MTQIISKKDLESWLRGLLQGNTVIAPTRVDDLTLFQPISSVDEIAFDSGNTALSAKGWFFPATDVLFTLERKDGGHELLPTTVNQRFVIFGLRPCDARGLAMLDRPFLDEPADTLYAQRRAQTSLVGLACRQAQPQCFCTSVGGAPDDATDVDILLTKIDDVYIVQTVTEKGKALLEGAILTEAETMPPPPPTLTPVPADGIVAMMRQVFDSPYWGRLADRCLHCNICAYVCPICYCFDIRDCATKGKIERIRSWESCQSPGFTRIAGGYDPRPTKQARLRQRFYHKLLYFPERFDVIACVGCGRCVSMCPVNIDIREVITDIQQRGAVSVLGSAEKTGG